MIELKNVEYFYRSKRVLNVPNLIINNGEKIAFMGLNGAGKTTLAELILRLREKHTGELIFNKEYVFNAVFQDYSFNDELTIKEIFYLYTSLYKIKADPNLFFNNFSLTEVQGNKFKNISGGQQQKFKFLISLLNNPDFLVLDEITTSLDYVWRKKIIDVIEEHLNKSATSNLLLISHNPEEIAKLCNRVILINKGEIEQDFALEGSYEDKMKKIESLINWDV